MSITGLIQGIGGEAPFVEKGRIQRRQERREDTQDKIAQEELGIKRRQANVQELGVQQRLAALQRLLQKDQEWKPVGTAKQMKDGSWAQLYFQPESGETKYEAAKAPAGGEFNTVGENAEERALGKFRAYSKAKAEGATQEALDRIWPAQDRLQWMNTQQGIVGFPQHLGLAAGAAPLVTNFKGYPPGYGSTTPPSGQPELDETDLGYVDILGRNGMTLDMVKKLYAGKNEYKLPLIVGQAIQKGFDPNNQMTSAAAQNVATAQSQIDVNKPLIELIDKLGLKDNNHPAYLMWSRAKYGAGRGTAGGLADEIANLELTKITSAANAMKGSSRSWAALSVALQHTPNVWVDSPMMIRRKLETIDQRLQDVINEQQKFGTKSGLPRQQVKPSLPRPIGGTIEFPGGKKHTFGSSNNVDIPQPIAPVRTP